MPHPPRRPPFRAAVLVVAAIAWASSGSAQAPPSDRWFPLRPGAEWTYRSTDGGTRARTAVRDTAIAGRAYVVLAETDRDGAGAVRTTRRYPVRLDGGTGRWLRFEGGADRPAVALAPCPLPLHALTTSTCDLLGGSSEARLVEEGRGVSPVGGGEREVATRTYASAEGFGVASYASGVGPVLFTEGRAVYALEAFTPGGPSAHDLDAAPVRAWPNPSAGPVTLSFGRGGPGRRAEVVDALGRRVLTVDVPPEAGAVLLDLPAAAGLYVVRVLDGRGGLVGTSRVVRAR